MATISNHDGSNSTRVCLVGGKWVRYDEVIATTSGRILALLASGPKTRRFLGRTIGGDQRFIDRALVSLGKSGRVTAAAGVGNRFRTWSVAE